MVNPQAASGGDVTEKDMAAFTSSSDSLVLEIAKRIEDPNIIESIMSDPAQRNPDPIFPHPPSWNDVALGGGYAGLLLFFSVLQQKGLLETRQEHLIHRFVLKIKEIVEAHGLKSLSLFSGVTGICFSMQQASLGGTRYQSMIKSLQEFLFNNIETVYFTPLREDIKQGRSSASTLHDVVQGLSGIGRYALENLSDPRFYELAEKIIVHLIARIQPFLLNGYKIPGWYLSENDPIHLGSQGPIRLNFNLGLAHGVTGILALFSLASLKGLEVNGQLEAIRLIADWIRSKSFVKDGVTQWSDAVTWEEEVGKIPQRKEARRRPAWCYGSLGISRSLFLAAKALGDQELRSFALTAFRQIFSGKQTDWEIVSPSLCHGMAGFLLITHEMAQEEGGEDLSVKVDMLKQSLLNFYNTDFPFGFKSVQYTKKGIAVQVNDPGFLEGTAGILLTLLHLSSSNNTWHLPLLIG